MVCNRCRRTVAAALNQFGDAIRWNADLEDCDKILRVETAWVSPAEIIRAMRQAGFICEELT